FGAIVFNDSLIFTGSASPGANVYKWNNETYLNLRAIALKDSTVVGIAAKSYAPEINTEMHDGNAVFTKDGNTMYFTRNNYKNGKRAQDEDQISHLQIFRAERVGGQWGNIVSLPFNSESYSTAHPALSPDESILYFASDMPGSLGSFDIYSVSIAGGKYSIPLNLGIINTIHKEQFPFVSANNNLYFSSDGHFGYGALDVFVSKITDTGLSEAVNVGAAVNSGYDDFSFSINSATRKGYFASNRPTGKGSDDIYSFIERPYDPTNAIAGKVSVVNADGSPIDVAPGINNSQYGAISKEADVVS